MIYFLQRESDGYIKIGHTGMHGVRFKDLSRQHGELKLLGIEDGAYKREKELHTLFAEFRLNKTEWFRDEPSLAEYIRNHTRHLETNRAAYVSIRVTRIARSDLYKLARDLDVSLNELLVDVVQLGMEAVRKQKQNIP